MSFFTRATISYAQCSFTNLDPIYCLNDPSFGLTGSTNYYGPGVTGTTFDPAAAGAGTHTLYATSGVASTYNINTSGTFSRIVAAGTAVNPPSDGEVTGIAIPFTFNFFGTNYTQLSIGRNALVGFGPSGVNEAINQSFPDPTVPNNIIAAAWDDLDIGGTIQYFTTGVAPFRKFIIDWDAVPRQGGAYNITTQIQLNESTNVIEIHTSSALFGSNGNFGTQGIENSDGSIAYPVTGRNNQSWNAVNDFVSFVPTCLSSQSVTINNLPVNNLSVGLSSASVCAGQNVTVTVTGSQSQVSYQVYDQLNNAVSSAYTGGGNINIVTNPLATSVTSLTVRATHIVSGCNNDLLDVESITVSDPPDTSDAGFDLENCQDDLFTLDGTPVFSGTGSWAVISGTANVITPLSPTSDVNGVPVGTSATLRWTVSNGSCTPSIDDVVLTNYGPPTTADAGPAILQQCDNSIFFMGANNPIVGTGSWSLVSGTATITNSLSPTTTVSGVPPGSTARLRWLITNGTCFSFDLIDLQNIAAPSTATAGTDQEKCNDGTFTMAGNTPGTGTGTWTLIAGTAAITTPGSPSTSITGVPAGSSATLRWTIENVICSGNSDDVILTNLSLPTASNAGTNQTLCGTSAVLNGNAPAIGVGQWSFTSNPDGLGNISDVNSRTSVFTGTAGQTYILTWTISNGVCAPSSSNVTIQFEQLPTASNAGAAQQICGNSTPLAANVPAIGTGQWSFAPGGNPDALPLTAFSNTASASSTFTGTSGQQYILRWTISNGTCTPSTSDVTIRFDQLPTASNAGTNQTLCGTSAVLNGNAPAIGVGQWSFTSNPDGLGNISDVNSRTSVFTGTAGQTYILTWTISNGVCAPSSSNVTIQFEQLPTASNAGAAQQICGNSTPLAANVPAIGTGQWSFAPGGNPDALPLTAFSNTASASSTFTGTSGQQYILRWTISNGTCTPSTSDVTIRFDQLPTASNAGTNQTLCGTSAVLNGNAPAIGVGQWSFTSNPDGLGNISDVNSRTSVFTGTAGQTYILTWTISNGVCAPSSSNVTIQFDQLPTIASAGPDQDNCNDGNFIMTANPSTIGTGMWTIVSGTVTITDDTSPVTTVTGLAAGSIATLRWTISNGTCSPSSDDVTLTNNTLPTVADAGPPQIEQCNSSTFLMSANVPMSGTGTWSIVTGSGITITNVNSPTTTILGVTAGSTVTLRWTISNLTCGTSSDDIDLINYDLPTVSNAGADLNQCDVEDFAMVANAPAIGIGAWSLISGTATISDLSSPTTDVTGVPAGTSATLRWTIINGPCTPSTDDIIVTNFATPPVADAGPVQIEQCNTSTFSMSANSAGVGSGNWIIVSGGPATITNVVSPTTTITGLLAGTSVVLRWTITNGVCAPTSDDITLIDYQPATIASAGVDQQLCGNTAALNANNPTIGTGEWSVVSGVGGSFTDPLLINTDFSGVAGTTYLLRWTITNGVCVSTDDVEIILKRIPDVAAADEGICNGESTTIAITNPNTVTGTQFNWVVQSATNVTGAFGGTGSVISQLLTCTDGVSTGTVVYRITPTANGCDGTPLDVTVTVSPKPIITDSPASFIQNICSGVALNLLPTSTVGGTVFDWTSTVVGTLSGVSVSGSGAITDTPINTTNTPAVIIYNVVPSSGSCIGTPVNYVITVNPIPDVTATDQTICSATSTNIPITNPNGVVGTTYSWVVQSNTNVSGASDGSGNNIAHVLTSTDGVSNGTVIFRITPSANGCLGSFVDVTVTVKPVPVFTNNPADFSQQICSGDALNFLPTTSIVGAMVSWTSSFSGPINPSSVTVSGSNSITDTPINTGNTSGTVTYHIIPMFNGCDGPAVDLVVLVRPLPSATASDITICSGENALINIFPTPKNVVGTTFSWTVTPSPNVTGAADGNGSTINQQLSTTDASAGTVIYSITPAANGCNGTPVNVTVTVNPKAVVSAGSDLTVCEPSSFPIVGTIGGSATTGTWAIVSGVGTISSSTVAGTNVSATYTVDPTDIGNVVVLRLTTNDPDGAGGPCTDVADDVNITVNRQARLTLPADYSVCEPYSIALSGLLSGSATSGNWSVITGAGTLSFSSVTGAEVTATYIVNTPTDIGSVLTFRLTTNDPDGTGPCVAEYNEINITVNESAKVDAGPNDAVCEDEIVQLAGSFSGTTSTVTWSGGSGAAQFSNVNDINSTYTLTAADIAAGNITLTLTTNDPDGGGPCGPASDQVVITINKLPEVFLSGLALSYAENDPPVLMSGFPTTPPGIFTGPGVLAGTNIFDPGNANIGFNVITYTYTNDNGCTNFDSKTIVVNELTSIDFSIAGVSGIAPKICGDIGPAYLIGTPSVADGKTPTVDTYFSSPDVVISGRIGYDGTNYYLDTDGLTAGVYYIQYTFTNSASATSTLIKGVTVYASPSAVIAANDACVDDLVQFTDASYIPPNALGGNITGWVWDFDDQDYLSNQQNPTYTYGTPNVYDVELVVTTDQGCTDTAMQSIAIGPPPAVDFTWSGICNSEDTQFEDKSTISGNFSFIEQYQWDFGDGDVTALGLGSNPIPPGTNGGRTTGTYKDPGHVFASFNEYSVRLTVRTDVGCVKDTVKRVYILDYPIATPITAYYENFESGNGTWFQTSLNQTSWAFGTPNGETINTAASGNGAWWTGINPNAADDQSTYLKNEKSEIIGPCLDLTGLERPMISLNYWSDLQQGFDGTVIQYSTDGGSNWATVGNADGAGLNWYNTTNLSGNPGGQDNYAWSDVQGEWRNARFNLDQIPAASRSQVIFRIAFGSNDDNPRDKIYNGFAFDDIFIGEKQRTVLVESFTNQGIAATMDNYLNGLYDAQSATKSESDFFKLEYHVKGPDLDSLNIFNPTAPNARGLLYGVAQPPVAVMDGILGEYRPDAKNPFSYDGTYTNITNRAIDRRALQDPMFDITLTVDPLIPSEENKVKGSIQITYRDSLQDYSDPVVLHLALVDDEAQADSRDYRYVVRKLLMGNEGVTLRQSWTYGGAVYTQGFEEIIDIPITDGGDQYLVAFVQDRKSRYVHQAVVSAPIQRKGVKPVGLEDDPIAAEIRDIKIFPNPASNVLKLSLPNQLKHEYTWRMIDQRGITVMNGDVNSFFDSPQEIDISRLANGIYFMQIISGNTPLIHRKIAVMNRN